MSNNTFDGNLLEIFLSATAYCLLHLSLDHMFLNISFFSKIIKNLNFKEKVLFTEKICSSINAVLLGIVGIYLNFFLDSFSLRNGGVINAFPPLLDHILCGFIGYSIYDLITMFITNDHWSMYLHHFVGIIGASSMLLVYRLGAFSLSLFTITEITALTNNLVWYSQIFLNHSKKISIIHGEEELNFNAKENEESLPLLKKNNLHFTKKEPPPPSFNLVFFVILRFITFIFVRLPVAPYTIYYASNQLGGFNNLYNEMKLLPPPCSLGITFCVFVMGTLNLLWTKAMLKSTMKTIHKYRLNKSMQLEIQKSK
ncbi:hypothetical protein HDU92_008951 [Lobulomyces angularis]|nr:hypothetical protein HDU92_008951 [Lobulomyces angularis]